MMLKTRIMVLLVAVWAISTPASAKSDLTKYSGTVKVTSGSYADGQCTSYAFTNRCPGGNCYCAQLTGTYSGTAGKGSATLDVTVDLDNGQGTIGSAGANGDGCSPIFGVLQITGSKDTETFDILGAGCGLLSQAVDLQSDATQFSGGCILVASDLFSNGGVTTCIATGKSPTLGTLKMNGSAEK
ncbi:MAG: hypothetical protein WCE23_06575 [Candidatus Binatus sp.]|uniref:hypothetical protein n=1 Tax=Candidatus Binatus sp. TaxID=2811406 RepID=UPI003C718DEA